jgi:hypothetical protein
VTTDSIKDERLKFDIIQVFRGQKFRRYLCDYSLPLLLLPNNAWPDLKGTCLARYCPEEDRKPIYQHPLIKKIQTFTSALNMCQLSCQSYLKNIFR